MKNGKELLLLQRTVFSIFLSVLVALEPAVVLARPQPVASIAGVTTWILPFLKGSVQAQAAALGVRDLAQNYVIENGRITKFAFQIGRKATWNIFSLDYNRGRPVSVGYGESRADISNEVEKIEAALGRSVASLPLNTAPNPDRMKVAGQKAFEAAKNHLGSLSHKIQDLVSAERDASYRLSRLRPQPHVLLTSAEIPGSFWFVIKLLSSLVLLVLCVMAGAAIGFVASGGNPMGSAVGMCIGFIVGLGIGILIMNPYLFPKAA